MTRPPITPAPIMGRAEMDAELLAAAIAARDAAVQALTHESYVNIESAFRTEVALLRLIFDQDEQLAGGDNE
jgi:hypothetical protein